MDNKSNKSSSDEDDEGLDPRIQVGINSDLNMYNEFWTTKEIMLDIACTSYKGHTLYISSRRLFICKRLCM